MFGMLTDKPKSDLFEKYYDCVGPGWKPILEALGARITSLSRKAIGWDEENGQPAYEQVVKPRIAQVKEKFGRLRVYVDFEGPFSPDAEERINDIDACVGMSESMSGFLCEECGKGGTETRSAAGSKYGWLKTYCKECHKKRDDKANFQDGKVG